MPQKIILLADDDIDDAEMFREALAVIDNSIMCHCAVNGSELLRQLSLLTNMPELIFLDLNMPIMNGWECLQLLKEDNRYRNIPVIMISTSSHKKEIGKAMDLGAMCYFVKPSKFSQLVQILQVIIDNLGIGLKKALSELQVKNSDYVFCAHHGGNR